MWHVIENATFFINSVNRHVEKGLFENIVNEWAIESEKVCVSVLDW